MGTFGSGGAEKALINLLNSIDYDRYDVDLQLFEYKGVNIRYIPQEVNVLPPVKNNSYIFKTKIEFVKYSVRYFNLSILARKIYYSVNTLLSSERSARLSKFNAWRFLKPYIPINKKEYDVAVGYIHGLADYYLIDCAKAKLKIGWVHTNYSQIPKVNQDLFYYRKMYKVVTVSQTCADALQQVFPSLNNIVMLPNLNCPQLIRKLAVHESANEMISEKGVWKIVTIGRLSEEKGIDLAIKATAIIKKRGIRIHWYVIGGGDLEQYLKKQILEEGVSDCFFLLGIKANPYPYILQADLIAQTSRREGKSVVLDEAKILAKPIVCTNYPSVGDQLCDGKDGVIVDISSDGIAEGIIGLMDDKEKYDSIVKYLGEQDYSQSADLENHYKLFDGEL